MTSDIIVGFPGETDEDFQDTLRLVEKCEYDALFIFKYSQRRGTPAAKLADDVTEEQKKVRFLELEARHRELQRKVYDNYIGRGVSVLVEGESARSERDMTGHSSCHKVVNFYGGACRPGDVVNVRITESKSNSLYGQLIVQ